MDEDTFAAAVAAEGYKVVARDVAPNAALDEHDHAWDTKGLVAAGAFTIAAGGTSRTYGAGEVFELGAGVPHTEGAGPEGARLVVGRRAKP